MAEGDKELPAELGEYEGPWPHVPGLPERPGILGRGEIRNPDLSAYEGSDFPPQADTHEAARNSLWGMATVGAGAAARRPSRAPQAPAISKGQGFDFSRKAMERVPNVPQQSYEADEPRWVKGTPEWVEDQKLLGKRNMGQLQSDLDRGREMGMFGWYNMEQLRDRFVAELGEKQAGIWFPRFLDLLAGLSAQSKPWINARNASYRYMLWRQGEPPPKKTFEPAEGYGHFLNKTHNDKVARIMSQDTDLFGPASDPKTFRFGQNMSGNLEPPTIDIHAMRALGPEGFLNASGKPIDVPQMAYHYIADVYRQLAANNELKSGQPLPPAMAQAGVWGGAGVRTNQKNPPDPFLKVFDDRVRDTAQKLGLPYEHVMRMVIKGQLPLKMRGGPVHDGTDHILSENYDG